MVNFTEAIHVAIVCGLLGALMGFIKIEHRDRKIGDVTFFHLLTLVLILFPNFLLLIGILLDLTMTNSFFITVIFMSILGYIRHLGTSFFNTEIFINSGQYVVFIIYIIVTTIGAFYATSTLAGAFLGILVNSLIPVVGLYHFNKSNISKSILISIIIFGLVLPILGWTILGLFYYMGKSKSNRA